MTYREAKKIKPMDVVTFVDRPMKVVSVDVDDDYRDVFVKCINGRTYHHSDLRMYNPDTDDMFLRMEDDGK